MDFSEAQVSYLSLKVCVCGRERVCVRVGYNDAQVSYLSLRVCVCERERKCVCVSFCHALDSCLSLRVYGLWFMVFGVGFRGLVLEFRVQGM